MTPLTVLSQWLAWGLAVIAALALIFGLTVANTWLMMGDPICDPRHPAYPKETYTSEPCGFLGALTPVFYWSTTQRSVAVAGPVAFMIVAGPAACYLARPKPS